MCNSKYFFVLERGFPYPPLVLTPPRLLKSQSSAVETVQHDEDQDLWEEISEVNETRVMLGLGKYSFDAFLQARGLSLVTND